MFKTLQQSAPLALLVALTACSSSDSSDPTPATGSLNGSVLNSPEPVGGVKVTLSGPGGTFRTTTSSAGTYTFHNVPEGEYTIDLCGQGVFDSDGNPIPDKINLHLPGSRVIATPFGLYRKPDFLPEKALGLTVDTAGTRTGTIPAGTILANENAGVTIVFNEETTVTFQDPSDTTLSITPVPVEQTPAALPNGQASELLIAIEPAGATFDIRPEISFDNLAGLPVGTQGVPIYRLNYSTGAWSQSGEGTVSADGTSILSDAGQGLQGTGWHTTVVETYCETTLQGRVTSDSGAPIEGALVTALNGVTVATGPSGEYSIEDLPLPSGDFDVTVTILPPPGSGFEPDESDEATGLCGSETDMGTTQLTSIPTDFIAPTITSSTPANDAADVADNEAITITFDDEMSPGSLTNQTVTLTAAGQSLSGELGVDVGVGSTVVTFLPAEALALETLHTLVIDGSVMDAAGNPMGESQTINFTTADSAAGGTPLVTITPGTVPAMDPGDDESLSITVQDASGEDIDGALVTWTSDAPNVVSVSVTGELESHMPGTATIRASFGTFFDEVSVTVNTPAINSVVLTGAAPTIAIGAGMTLTAEARDAGNTRLAGFVFDWTSSNDSIATVDAGGNVRALTAGGPVTITATEPGSTLDASYAITVLDPQSVVSVEVSSETDAIGPDTAVQLSAVANDPEDDAIPGVTFTWSSSNSSVAAVNASGLVTAVGSGSVEITATADGSGQVAGSVELDVYPYEPTIVRLLEGDSYGSVLEGAWVVLHDPTTGEHLDGTTTNSDGYADFGFTDVPRVTVSYYLWNGPNAEGLSGDDGEYAFTAVNVPAGRMTLTKRNQEFDDVYVDVSFPSGAEELAMSAGEIVEPRTLFRDVSTSPASAYFPISTLDANGDLPVIGTAFGSGTTGSREIVAGQYNEFTVLEAQEGDVFSMTLSAAAVSSVPFTAQQSVLFTGSRFRQLGRLFAQESGVTESADSGAVAFVAPPNADRFGYRFERTSQATWARTGRELFSDSMPTSLNVGMPSLGLSGFSWDMQTNTLSWNTTGASTGGLDVGRARFIIDPYSPGAAIWDVVFDASASSIVLPQDKGLPYLTGGRLAYEVELFNLNTTNSFDSFMADFRAQRGRFDQTVIAEASRVDSIAVGASQFRIETTNGGNGTLTYNLGEGPVTVVDGDIVEVPIGSPVTFVATAASGFYVGDLGGGQGTTVGVGQSTATLTIESNEAIDQVTATFYAQKKP